MGYTKEEKRQIAKAVRSGKESITLNNGSSSSPSTPTSTTPSGASSQSGYTKDEKKLIAQAVRSGKTSIDLPGYQPPKLEDFANANPLSATVQSLTNQRDTIANQKYSDPMSQFMQKRGVTELDSAIQNQSQKERWAAARRDLVTDTLLSPIGQNNTVPMRAFTPVAEYNPLSEGPADILSRLASSGEGKVNEAKHNHANAVASAQGQYDRSLRAIAEAERKLPQLDQQIEDVTNRVGMATDPAEAQRLSSQLADLKKQREEYEKAIPSAEDTIYRLVTPKEEIDRSEEAFAAHKTQTESQQRQLNQILSNINELRNQSGWVTDPDQGERIGEEIDALKAQAHRMLLDNPELVNSSDEALGQSVFSAAAKGANQVASGFSDLLQMVFGDFAQEIWNMVGLDSHDNPITWLNKGVHDDAQKLQEYYAPEVRGNRAAEIVDKYGTTIVAALPAAAMAYATAGGSMATTESLMFASDIAELSGGAQTIAQVGNAVRKMSTSPNFLMSFAQEAGSSYNEALEDGMSETDATVYSMMYGYLAALVEVGGTSEVGGLQQYVDELAEGKKGAVEGIKDYVKSILAEGDEEKLQGILQRGLKSFFGVETAVTPNGQTGNVILDPTQMWEDTKGAWAAAGVMGAPGMVNNTANAIYESRNNAAPQATENAGNANANPAAGSSTVTLNDVENSDADGNNPHFDFVDAEDSAQQQQKISDAYDKAVNEGKGVVINSETLDKYTAIANNPVQKLIAAVKAYYDSALKGTTVDVQIDGGVLTIMFENDGKKKSVGWRMNAEKAATFESLRELTENSVYAYSEMNRSLAERDVVPRFHYFVNNAVIQTENGSKNVPVKIQTRDIVGGQKPGTHYYTHGFTQNETKTSGPSLGESTQIAGNAADLRSAEGTPSTETIPQSSQESNSNVVSSPVVDALVGRSSSSESVSTKAILQLTGDIDTDTDTVYTAATPLQEDLNNHVRAISEMLGTQYEDSTQKSKNSIKNKVTRKHADGRTDYSILDMKDHARSKVFVNEWNEIPQVLSYLQDHGIQYETEAIGPTPYGYKGFHVTWRDSQGLGAELQVTMPDVWQVKLKSDAIYDKWRDVKDLSDAKVRAEYYSDLMQSRKMWDEIQLPDFALWDTSAAESSLPSQISDAETGDLGSTHLPPTNSRSFSGEKSSTRPDSVSTNISTPPSSNSNDIITQNQIENNNTNVNDSDDHTPPSGPSSPGGTPAVDSDTIETRERGESRNIRTDEARDQQLRDFKEKNPDIYKVVKNNRTLRKAMDIFDSQGVEGSAQTLERALYDAQNGRKLPLEMVPLHKLVCDELSRQGQVERANRISSDLGAELTYAGQLGQANVILRSASPTAQADAFAKTVERLISENNADIDQESVDDLISRYRSAETQEAREAVVDDAMTAIAQSSPTTFREALNAIRYLNMLGNFKTQIRNVAGNTGMLVMARAKNRILALEQMAWNAAFRNHQITQTNTLTTNPELFREAWRMFSEDRDAAVGEGKYSDVAQGNKAVREKKTVFKWNWKSESDSALRKIADAPMKVLEAYRKATSWAMEEGDVIFQKVTYAQTLADYAKAQGYSSLQDIDPDTLQTMREYAIREAQEATFHDKNAVSEWFSGFDRDWDAKYGRVGKAAKTVTQGVVPFRQTPANVGVRMEEYSPLGVVNTFVDAYSAIKGSGDVDANTVLNAAAKTLSGTGLAVLGYVLAKHGLARGKEDDKELEAYERNVQGLSDYSIVLPDGTSVSLDWFAPESASFFVGVAAADAFKDGAQADDIIALLGSTSDIAMNMSFLSGLQDSLDKLSSFNGNMGALPTFLLNSLISFGGQIATNSLLGQAEQASERYRQTSYSDKEGILPTGLQYTASKLTSKMPGIDYNQADYIDAWGRKQDNGENVAGRVAESFFSPAYINESRTTEIDDELKRLHEATKDAVKGSVLPTVASRTTKVGDQTLTPEEYELYQTRNGQTALKLVSDFINGEGYDSMSDDDRAKVINDLYGFARDTAKNSVLLSRGEQTEKSDYDKARAIKDAGGMSWAQYYQTKEGRDMDGNGSSGAEETAQYLFENFPEDKAKKIFNVYYPDSKTPYEEYAGHAQEIKDAGFTKQEYDALTATVKEAKTGAESWDSKGDNAVIDAVVAAVGKGLSEDGATLLITENTSKYYANPYSALIDSGRSMQESMDILNMIDAPGKKDGKEVPPDKAIQQAELKAYYKEHPEEEVVIALIWDSMGYTGKNTKDFETYKKTLK